MLSSIADVLDIPLPHLFRWGTARAEVAGSQVGYGMIVDRDTLDWVKVSRELDLPGDVTPDVREGPVHAIGVNARILLTPGAQDVHAVGSDAAGRAQVARRHADYEAWKAIR